MPLPSPNPRGREDLKAKSRWKTNFEQFGALLTIFKSNYPYLFYDGGAQILAESASGLTLLWRVRKKGINFKNVPFLSTCNTRMLMFLLFLLSLSSWLTSYSLRRQVLESNILRRCNGLRPSAHAQKRKAATASTASKAPTACFIPIVVDTQLDAEKALDSTTVFIFFSKNIWADNMFMGHFSKAWLVNIVPPIGEEDGRKGELRKGGGFWTSKKGGRRNTNRRRRANTPLLSPLFLEAPPSPFLFFRLSSAFPRKMLFILRTFALLSLGLVLSKASLS